jgi:membrane protease subunit (stomatin/prohibitin family)
MSLFQSNTPKEKKHKGILGAFSVDVIKWEPESDNEASLIVHKFEYEDFPNGSYLIVNPSQMAIFTNNMSAGNSIDSDGSGESQISVFMGPCKIKLETGDSRFAPFRNIEQSLTGGESAFHSTVYFVNTTYMNELSWGTQAPIVVMDPEEEINVHVRAFGLFGVHIEHVDTSISTVQARKFLHKVVGTRSDYTRNELVQFMRAKILEYVPDLLAKSIMLIMIWPIGILAMLGVGAGIFMMIKSKKDIRKNIDSINRKYADMGVQGKNKIAACLNQWNEAKSIADQFNKEPIRKIIA